MKVLVIEYMALGLNRDVCLSIIGLTRNQFYYKSKGTKPGRRPTDMTIRRDPVSFERTEVDNIDLMNKIVDIKLNADLANWYKLITRTLQLDGYYINHKKVYRLMKAYLLLENKRNRTGRTFVKYRRVTPSGPLRVLEMDIKYFWIHEKCNYAFVLTIIDTFTRYVLNWSAGYKMKSEQVKCAWEYVVANYLQTVGVSVQDIDVDVIVRSDNGKQFNSNVMSTFFEDNKISHEFTRPYTPEENGHVESFHCILGKSLDKDQFCSLGDLEKRLERFYTSYNNDRSHSGTKGIPPSKFWALSDLGKVEVIYLKNKKQQFKLSVAYQDIMTLPGIHKYDYRENRT